MAKSNLVTGKFLLMTSDCGSVSQLRVDEDGGKTYGTEAAAKKAADVLVTGTIEDGCILPTVVIVKVVKVGSPAGNVSWK